MKRPAWILSTHISSPSLYQRMFIILFGVLFIALAWRFLLLHSLVPLDGNIITISYPNWSLARWFFEHRTFPLWNPWRNMGEPFLADPQTMACYPFFWLLAGIHSFHRFLAIWYVAH